MFSFKDFFAAIAIANDAKPSSALILGAFLFCRVFTKSVNSFRYESEYRSIKKYFAPLIGTELKDEDKKYLEINDRLSKKWPLITEAKPAPDDAKEWENKPDKLNLLEE